MNLQATLAATLVDEWVRAGLTDAVVCPGSRSTPLALALADAEAAGRLRLHVFLDERAGAFCALGLGMRSGRPALVLTTSGTAAVEAHPAVVEAAAAGVPLLVCTADRPAHLHGVGAPQTIDQHRLFGAAAGWFAEIHSGLPSGTWRSMAARAWVEAVAGGPVQVNLPFDEPLAASRPARAHAEAAVPPARPGDRPWHAPPSGPPAPAAADVQDAVAALAGAQRGLVVAGRGAGDPEAVMALAHRAGWVVLADPLSGCRVQGAIGAFDPLLRVRAFADGHRPDAILRLGALPASRVLAGWLGSLEAPHVVVTPHGWPDPQRRASVVLRGDPGPVLRALGQAARECDPAWAASWRDAEAAAQEAIDEVLAAHTEPTEPYLARALVAALPEGSALMVSSSMPVRAVEWFARPRTGLRVLANRGANGIDGVVATALGVALARPGHAAAALVGDLALLHDVGALLWAAERRCDLAIVVADNAGGGIFEFLPQAQVVDRPTFERLFATPHGLDLCRVAAAYGIPATVVRAAGEIVPAVKGALAEGGVRLVVVRTDRQASAAVHAEITRAVARALGAQEGET